ncbi:unnamed protein product [Colias eurytheme]|nr:unnamed protein product [Colias eurytheme]
MFGDSEVNNKDEGGMFTAYDTGRGGGGWRGGCQRHATGRVATRSLAHPLSIPTFVQLKRISNNLEPQKSSYLFLEFYLRREDFVQLWQLAKRRGRRSCYHKMRSAKGPKACRGRGWHASSDLNDALAAFPHDSRPAPRA